MGSSVSSPAAARQDLPPVTGALCGTLEVTTQWPTSGNGAHQLFCAQATTTCAPNLGAAVPERALCLAHAHWIVGFLRRACGGCLLGCLAAVAWWLCWAMVCTQ